MQPFKRKLNRRDIRRELKSFGVCLLTVTALVISAFALAHLRNQFDSRMHTQNDVAYFHDPSNFEP